MAILTHTDGSILRDGTTGAILRVPDVSYIDDYIKTYVIPDTGVRPTIYDIDLSLFTDYGLAAKEPIPVTFPEQVGYVAFALALSIPKRLSWYELNNPFNYGVIGGNYKDEFANLWPAGELKIYNDTAYLVYWTSYVTKFLTTQQLRLKSTL